MGKRLDDEPEQGPPKIGRTRPKPFPSVPGFTLATSAPAPRDLTLSSGQSPPWHLIEQRPQSCSVVFRLVISPTALSCSAWS